MTETALPQPETTPGTGALTRAAISAALDPAGWRLLMGSVVTSVPVASLAEAAQVAARIAAAAEGADQRRLRIDLRPDRVIVAVGSALATRVRAAEVELALRITHALAADGITTDPDAGRRTAQVLELAIDALDPAAIRPFWVAVLGYGDEPRNPGSDKPIMDPYEQGPTIWFQVMDAPRPQRNRIHFDLAVSPDQARPRIDAAVAAGGRVVSDAAAPAFWVLADPEGNEVCVCTWEGRD